MCVSEEFVQEEMLARIMKSSGNYMQLLVASFPHCDISILTQIS